MHDVTSKKPWVLHKVTPAEWDQALRVLPNAHILQTSQWAEVKLEVGWEASYYCWQDAAGIPVAGSLVLVRKAGLGPVKVKIMYAPRGPLLDWSDPVLRSQVLADLKVICQNAGCVFLKIDPEIILGEGIPGEENALENSTGLEARNELLSSGWILSPDQIQFQNTAWLDLNGTEEDWLARMKQKTRYNLRLSMKKGVVIRSATPEDFPALYRMYAETSVRDGFVIRSASYYDLVWRKYYDLGMAHPLIAEVDGVPIAGLVMMTLNKTAWYLYGMSTEIDREKMPNYYLQWEAMRLAKSL
ncbi:MAG: aminoacyltransferase, partial [Anaerolineaceae bacterium]|nr:aminoacyltransferase [Anaerolineaceae bacterium]